MSGSKYTTDRTAIPLTLDWPSVIRGFLEPAISGTPAVIPAAGNITPVTFSIFYGLNATNRAWVVCGQMNPEDDDFSGSCALSVPAYDPSQQTQCNFTVNVCGQLINFSTDNANPANDTGILADTYPIVIERSTNCVDWEPIWTNQISLETTNQFTDFNGPPDHAFYRAVP